MAAIYKQLFARQNNFTTGQKKHIQGYVSLLMHRYSFSANICKAYISFFLYFSVILSFV
jgi:hypothetical protein